MKSLNDCQNCRDYEKIVSKATAEEQGLIFELINKSGFEIAKWKIDNCALKAADGSKCDYLMIVKDRAKSACYWIELKDQDIDDACLQIYSTIKSILEAKQYATHYARIVLGRFTDDRNRIKTLRYTNLKKLINVIGGIDKLKYKTKVLTEII